MSRNLASCPRPTRDGVGWEVFVVSAGGVDDVAIFDQFVATFEFTK